MKKLIIFIPGSKVGKILLVNKLTGKFIYRHLGLNANDEGDLPYLKKYFEQYIDAKVLYWSGGLTNLLSFRPACKKLIKLINDSKSYDQIILFGKSFGGKIAEMAVRKLGSANIAELVYVATPHKMPKVDIPDSIKIINIYSKADILVNFGNKFYYWGRGVNDLENAQNISLDNIRHSDFNENMIVEYQGEKTRLFDLYRRLIL